jgi:ribose transport system permease protein
MFAIVVATAMILTVSSRYFATVGNIRILAIGIAEDSLLMIGMTLLLISGVFDLSISATLAFAGVCSAKLVLAGTPLMFAFLVAVLVGTAIGFVLGILVAKCKVNALIASLGMQYVVKGLTLAITKGFPVSMMPENYTRFGQGNMMKIPNSVIIMFALLIVSSLLLHKFVWLRSVYYLGGNEDAAKLAGFPTERMRIALFTIMGTLASFAGIIMSSRLASAGVTFGTGAEMRVIAACVIGGVSLNGGKGTILGAFLGLLFLALINDALILLNVEIYYQSLITGIILVVAVLLDSFQNRVMIGR